MILQGKAVGDAIAVGLMLFTFGTALLGYNALATLLCVITVIQHNINDSQG